MSGAKTRITFSWISILGVLLSSLALGDPGTLKVRIGAEPETLDWNRAHTEIEGSLLTNIMEGLVAFDPSFRVQPALAQSWSVSPDGITYTFKIRKSVHWSDGVELKAQDFASSWIRLLSPRTDAPYAYLLFDIKNAKEFNSGRLGDASQVGIKALDDLDLQVTLSHPRPRWLEVLTFWATFPIRQNLIDQYGGGWATPGRMATLGPYLLVSHDLGQKYVFVANPKYYRKHGNLREFEVLIISDDRAALQLFRDGKLDIVTNLGKSDSKQAASTTQMKTFPRLRTEYLGFSTNHYPFDNPFLRKAIAAAIDRRELAQAVYGGLPAGSFVAPPIEGSSKSMGIPYDPRAARQFLGTSGVEPWNLKATLMYLDNADESAVARSIREQVRRNLGIDLKLQPLLNRVFRLNLDLRSSPLFLAHWAADYPDPDNFLSIFTSGAGTNRFSWTDVGFDQDMEKARELTSPEKRKELYLGLQKTVIEKQAIVVPLFYQRGIAFESDRIRGTIFSPLGYLDLREVSVSGK